MKKVMKLVAGAAICAGMIMSANAVMAEETVETKSTFAIDGTDVANTTDLVIKEGKIETTKDGDVEINNVILTDETGKTYTFEKVDVKDWKDLSLAEEYEMIYIKYTDETGKSREAEEKADEIIWETPVTMYVNGSVNVRKAPQNEAEAISYANLGEEYSVVGVAPGWFKVQLADGSEAYIYHKYLTEDKAAVDALVEAAAASASSSGGGYDYSYDYSYSAPTGGGGGGTPEQCLQDGLLY